MWDSVAVGARFGVQPPGRGARVLVARAALSIRTAGVPVSAGGVRERRWMGQPAPAARAACGLPFRPQALGRLSVCSKDAGVREQTSLHLFYVT